MKYDLAKIRATCLELLGWARVGKGYNIRPLHTKRTVIIDGRSARIESYDDYESKGPHDVLVSPHGERVFLCGCDGYGVTDAIRLSDVPDPTSSLDDALPLIKKYKVCLYSPGCSFAGGEYTWDEGWAAECRGDTVTADTAPLAVCLAVLCDSGRDLKDFEVPE